MEKPAVLIVDDDEDIRTQLRWAIANDYDVAAAEDRPAALTAFASKKPDVVLLDLGLPPFPGDPREGFSALAEFLALEPKTKIIIISGQGDRTNALRAIGEGAYDFLTKPVDIDELKTILRRAAHIARLERDYAATKASSTDEAMFEDMVGQSTQMQHVFGSIRKLAATSAPVLILGESGTGKEMAALAIHRRSPRKNGPFVAINCGAIPENLIESELFGHERGSFTGAHMQRPGKIEVASGGTLFLDEIGELPLALQVKFLRFLQEKRIERVGGRKTIEVDIRVVAATNADLEKGKIEGRFREDLYYRLAVVVLKLPSLRDRDTDAVTLAEAFLKKFAVEFGKRKLRFSKDALDVIKAHAWPGNVRELENRVKRAVIMADETKVTAVDLELAHVLEGSSRSLRDAREELEREMVTKALRRHEGNITAAAADLGITRPTFYELLDKLGLRKGEGQV